MNNNWTTIRKDFDLLPVEGVNGKASEKEITDKLLKYGISLSGTEVTVTLWGTGSPMREFLHSDDMADACVYIMENIDFKDLVEIRKKTLTVEESKEIKNTHINIGTGRDLTIGELAMLVKRITGFNGKLVWDSSKPDGTARKLLNVDKLHALGWKETIELEQGIQMVYKDYCSK
jgi:GDP-L-fucose synthase